MKKIILFIILCLLLTACGVHSSDKPDASGTESTDEPTDEPTISSPVYADALLVVNDTLTMEDQTVIQGTDLSFLEDTALDTRFAQAEQTYGLFSDRSQLFLSFPSGAPSLITWSADEGFQSIKQGTATPGADQTAVVELGINYGAALSSDTNNIPHRKVRIVCHYEDRCIEYLLILESKTFSYENAAI